MSKPNATGSDEVTIDRRTTDDRRQDTDRRQQESLVDDDRRQTPRRKVARRRQIDPTTCERDYTNDEIEFMQALDAYKRANGRMFPTCSEILEVVRGLGYVRLEAADDEADDSFEDDQLTDEDGEITEAALDELCVDDEQVIDESDD